MPQPPYTPYRPTAESVLARLEGHETLCDDRHDRIRDDIRSLKGSGFKIATATMTVLLSGLGFLAWKVVEISGHLPH